MNEKTKKCAAKDIKPKVVYYMTFDYWPDGGTPVVLKKKVPAKTIWKGSRGDALIMVGVESKQEFVVSKDSWLFAEKP